MTTLLVDGDLFAYQLAAGSEQTIDFGETVVRTGDAETASYNLEQTFHGYADRLGADRIVVALSDTENFRKAVMPTYKANREGIERPAMLETLKAHLQATFECIVRPKLEADDVLGILLTNAKVIPGRKIVVTEDKDLRSVPGLHWNPKKEGELDKGPTLVSVAQADANFYAQVLSGDQVDGYGGCPGVGVIGAARLVAEPVLQVRTERELKRGPRKGQMVTEWHTEPAPSVWACIVSHYEKAGLTEEDAIRAARVARILRTEDYDYQRKEPKLWTPK